MTTIDLRDGWTIRPVAADIGPAPGTEIAPFKASVPFDVHSRLLEAGAIPDPYYRANETAIDWVHEARWIASRDVRIDNPAGRWTLTLDRLDGCADVLVNGEIMARCESAFVRHDIDVGDALRAGANRVEIRFDSTSALAAERATALPFPVPYVDWNCRIPHVNLFRKSQCDAGWDWNIALMPLGLYGAATLRRHEGKAEARWDDLRIVQRHADGVAHVTATAFVDAREGGETDVSLGLCGETVTTRIRLVPGENALSLSVAIPDPELWWPVGQGAQPLHDLTMRVGKDIRTRRIGLRDLRHISMPDAPGRSFGFRVNGRDVVALGANWVPADALPERRTPDKVRRLLQSALDANMTMIRVWGGGVYEPDWFYDLCDEMGLMVWQDFMFACHQFPAHDDAWLALVETEARQQMRRLSGHACLALWCGDNEGIPALDWWPETRANRDRYLALWVRLNETLRRTHRAEGVEPAFWSTSPSRGPHDYGHDWYEAGAGDAHFWAVWHGEGEEAGRFEEFRRIEPRFASEFGFQSFPTMACIERFTEPEDRAFDGAVMAVHQRNAGGNAKIVDTMRRYFPPPETFKDQVFLSQVQQAMAIRVAVEHWRAAKPRSMGSLYWQFNDTWPVASWSGLDHGGAWKVLHYAMRRAHAPVLVTGVPDGDALRLVGVCERPEGVALTVTAERVSLDGTSETLGEWHAAVPPDRAVKIARVPLPSPEDGAFIHLAWRDDTGAIMGEADHVAPGMFACHALPAAHIAMEWGEADGAPALTLQSDAPAFFVTVGLGLDPIWSDNAFTLLPNRPRLIRAYRTASGADPAMIERSAIDVQHVGSVR